MEIAVWIIQGLLAAAFTFAGIMKATQSKEKLAANMPWVNDYSAGAVKFIGVSELLGGIGLIVPWLTGIVPVLTPVAAVALAVVMVLAAVYHARKNEIPAIGINGVMFVLLSVVAYYRFGQL